MNKLVSGFYGVPRKYLVYIVGIVFTSAGLRDLGVHSPCILITLFENMRRAPAT